MLADLSESARGDSYLTRAIPWDLLVGAILTLIILAIDPDSFDGTAVSPNSLNPEDVGVRVQRP